MTRKEIAISDIKQIMDIALHYANPEEPYLDEWHEVYMVAESLYEELNR